MNNENMYCENNTVYQKAKRVSIQILKVCQTITQNQDYTIMGPLCCQLTRSCTSVCSNISEGSVPYISRRDRTNKFLISLKELSETCYWLDTMYALKAISEKDYKNWCSEYNEIEKILSKSVLTMQRKLKKQNS